MNAADPKVGDVFEYRKPTGKRIRLIEFHDNAQPWRRYFETRTMEHPSSPRMVGAASWVRADRLVTSQFRYIGRDGANREDESHE